MRMDWIYIGLLLKVLYNFPLIPFIHTLTHLGQWTTIQSTGLTIRNNRGSVSCSRILQCVARRSWVQITIPGQPAMPAESLLPVIVSLLMFLALLNLGTMLLLCYQTLAITLWVESQTIEMMAKTMKISSNKQIFPKGSSENYFPM